jgi:hypothetical protein
VSRRDDNRAALRKITGRGVSAWDAFLRQNSRLPGPRANLELLHAAVDEGDDARFRHWREIDRGDEDAPDEFVVCCGVTGLGQLAASAFDRSKRLPPGPVHELKRWANDPRWRVREAVAMGLQRIGDASPHALCDVAEKWVDGTAYQRRAAVAGVCEPRFCVRAAGVSARIAAVLDRATSAYAGERDRRADGPVALRKALSYGWSVALAGDPRDVVPVFDRWARYAVDDADVRRMVRENLTKSRIAAVIPGEIARWSDLLSS